jgi:uncharacterized protein YcbX
MTIAISALRMAPVKGTRLNAVDELELVGAGVVGDRAFMVVDEDAGLLLTSRTPALLQVESAWEDGVLALRFPDGSEVSDDPSPGASAVTRQYDGREVPGRLVDGPLAAALSEHLGRPVRLLMRDADQTGTDDFPVTLMSEASLRALAEPLGGSTPDARRFRMSLTIDGVGAWEEHGWAGSEVAVGEALLRVVDPVPRCVVTTRDPVSGTTDAPVLKALAQLRGKRDVTFGVWCEVARPGRVRLGDAVVPQAAAVNS